MPKPAGPDVLSLQHIHNTIEVFSKAGMSLERPEIDDATRVDPL